MPQPTRSDVHVNRPLTNMSTAYIQSADDFIADKVFPIVPVQKQSDLYFTYNKGDWFRAEAQKRAPGTESAGSGYALSTDSYRCEVFAIHRDVDDSIVANADTPLDVERDSTMWVTQQLMLKREVDFLNAFMASGVWDTDLTGSASPQNSSQFIKWSDTTNSDPIKDINSATLTITKKTGYRPNTLVLTPAVYNALRQNTKIINRIVYTQRGIVTTDILSALFDVERVFVTYAIQNSAKEGQTDSLDFIKNDGALLCYTNAAPSIMQPSAGYTFAWSGLYGASAYGNRIKRFRREEINSVRIEGEMSYTQKKIGSDLGVWFGSVL